MALESRFFRNGEQLGELIAKPLSAFLSLEASGGVLLVVATVLALIWTNSAWAPYYHEVFHSHIQFATEGFTFTQSVHFWINDGLMTIFFFVVGLEIKREFLMGSLTSAKRAVLPLSMALGGMILPAGIYHAFNMGSPGEGGWAIPMATDIAFVLGALTVLGSRVPYSLQVLLTALAIVDDIGAVLVIAMFYTPSLSVTNLGYAALLLLLLVAFNLLGYRRKTLYLIVGAFVWWQIYLSGVHSTVAGILVALTIPTRSRFATLTFVDKSKELLSTFSDADNREYTLYTNEQHQCAVRSLERLCKDVQTPSHRMEYLLHPWVVYFVVPLFALANAGITLDWKILSALTQTPIAPGIIIGLVLGKQIGIAGAAWLAIRSGYASLPSEISFSQLYGGAVLCGIGFTMSLFISNLSFTDETLLESAKLSIFIASFIALVGGIIILHATSKGKTQNTREKPTCAVM